jgi:DNA invertase Pin-like site-specific DNA recombinase
MKSARWRYREAYSPSSSGAMIQECVRAGLARARAQGKRLGRPRIDGRMERRIREALARGDRGILWIAADLGVGSGTVQRVKAALTA